MNFRWLTYSSESAFLNSDTNISKHCDKINMRNSLKFISILFCPAKQHIVQPNINTRLNKPISLSAWCVPSTHKMNEMDTSLTSEIKWIFFFNQQLTNSSAPVLPDSKLYVHVCGNRHGAGGPVWIRPCIKSVQHQNKTLIWSQHFIFTKIYFLLLDVWCKDMYHKTLPRSFRFCIHGI